MSRGAGSVMQALEPLLTDRGLPLPVLAACIFDTEQPTKAQVESVRRAARRLHEMGRAHVMRDLYGLDDASGYKRRWRSTTTTLVSLPRRPPTAQERRKAMATMERVVTLGSALRSNVR